MPVLVAPADTPLGVLARDQQAGWQRIGQTSGKEYISLSISAPEFGKTPKSLLKI